MDPAAPARLRARPLLVSRHAFHQPRPRADLARGHGGRPRMVPRPLAQSARHRPALRRAHRPLAPRPLAHLSAPHAPHAPLGGDPDRPGTRGTAPARRARGGNASRAHALQHGRSLHACPPRPLGGESVGGFRQSVLLLIAWAHGCVGLHFWLRLRPWYRRSFPVILSAWMLVPLLAWLGFAEAGRDVAALARQPGFVQRLMV